MGRRGSKPGKSKHQEQFDKEDRLEKVTRYMLMHWTHQRIADELKVSRSLISTDVKEIRERFKKAQVINVTELKQQQLAELDVLKSEAWGAWERSKGREEKQGKKAPKGKKKSIRQEDQAGERGFITEIRAILSDRADLVGMAPPKQLNLNDISNRPIDQLIGQVATKLPVLAQLLSGTGATGRVGGS